MTSSKADVEPLAEMWYVPSSCLKIHETGVLRCVFIEEEDFNMFAKMRQFPPSICMAPLVAMHTIVSRPWMYARLEA